MAVVFRREKDLFLTGCSIMGSIFSIWLSFFGGKSIREYFMDKSGAMRHFFAYVGAS